RAGSHSAALAQAVQFRRAFPSELRNTIRQDDAIEPLELTHHHGIGDTTLGAGASNTIHEGSPEVGVQIRAVLHLICEVRYAVPAHFHLRRADRDQRFESGLRLTIDEV